MLKRKRANWVPLEFWSGNISRMLLNPINIKDSGDYKEPSLFNGRSLDMKFSLIEPLADYSRISSIDETGALDWMNPLLIASPPEPGLAVRIVGEVTASATTQYRFSGQAR